MDSLKGKNDYCLNSILLYLYQKQKQLQLIPNISFDKYKKSWKLSYLHDIIIDAPFQTNNSDCAVFYLLYGYYMASGKQFNFTQEQIGELRFTLALNLLKKRYW